MEACQRIIVTSAPENSETPLDRDICWVTPNPLFFVRNHFEPPTVADAANWELTLDGLGLTPRKWTVAELSALPQQTLPATVECAGNGRSFLNPPAEGVPWGPGAIGHAEWSGVRLRDLLADVAFPESACELVCEGADHGTEDGIAMNFSRSLPLAKALAPDTLLALRMNGQPLCANHGAPLRLIVPGWYGVASVKWLRRLTVIDHAYQGFFQTVKYSVDRPTAAGKQRVPLGPGVVKSEILGPRAGETLPRGSHRIHGVAWAGEDRIARVEVSTDGGATWRDAQLQGPALPYCWCQWEYAWEPTTGGGHELVSRAHSAGGQTQPAEYDPDNLGYIINTLQPRKVWVS
ncbi:MAG: sulfite oxidase [Verrucomicrobia bacterium]|nr:sulfite oxidase [Verrucomicrobiota bacterium]